VGAKDMHGLASAPIDSLYMGRTLKGLEVAQVACTLEKAQLGRMAKPGLYFFVHEG